MKWIVGIVVGLGLFFLYNHYDHKEKKVEALKITNDSLYNVLEDEAKKYQNNKILSNDTARSRTLGLIELDKKIIDKVDIEDTSLLRIIRRHVEDFKLDGIKQQPKIEPPIYKKEKPKLEKPVNCVALPDLTVIQKEYKYYKEGKYVKFKVRKLVTGCHIISFKLIIKEDNKPDKVSNENRNIYGINTQDVIFFVGETKDREFYLELNTPEHISITIPDIY